MAAQNQVDPQHVTPEEFARLVKGSSDGDIASIVHQAGTADVLDRIFEGMELEVLTIEPSERPTVNRTLP